MRPSIIYAPLARAGRCRKPSKNTLAERAAEAKMWMELNALFHGHGPDSGTRDDYDTERSPGGASMRFWDQERDLVDLLEIDTHYADGERVSGHDQIDDTVTKSRGKSDARLGKRARGRPPTLSRELIESIATTIRYGSSLSDAATGLSLNRRTLLKWLGRGKRERDGLYHDLLQRVTEARRERSRLSPLREVVHAKRATSCTEPLDLSLRALGALRRCTGVRYLQGEPVDNRPNLIELRWPRPGRGLSEAQTFFLNTGLQVLARDSCGGVLSIIFLAEPPTVRARKKPPLIP